MAGIEDDGVPGAPEQESLREAKERLQEARRNLKTAVRDVRTARRQLRDSAGHDRRNAMLFLAGLALVVLFNPATGPSTRRWLLGCRSI